jgi:hypothetical protein
MTSKTFITSIWMQADSASSAVQLYARTGTARSALFNRKRRKIVVSGHTIQKLGGGNSTGQTILAWNLRLTRVK